MGIDNDKDVRLIKIAREVRDALKDFGRNCPLAEEILIWEKTSDGRDKIFALPEIKYDSLYNHLTYHLTYRREPEEEVARNSSNPAIYYQIQ